MFPRTLGILTAAISIALLPTLAAQGQFRGGWYRRSYEIRDPQMAREQQDMANALGTAFRQDSFTFARLKFEAERDYRFGGGRLWDDDTPEADLNLIFRLHQVTSLRVRPGLNFIDITTKELEGHPFVYVASAGRLVLRDDEVLALRGYLLRGGFLMADDFWGDDQWDHFHGQLRRVFPDREPVELTLDHPIFHVVFDFKKAPQIPSVGTFLRTRLPYDPGWPFFATGHEPRYFAVYDDRHRMMAIICHNNHYGDGWEHETDDQSYFDTFSEPMAYPMLINILVYTMSH